MIIGQPEKYCVSFSVISIIESTNLLIFNNSFATNPFFPELTSMTNQNSNSLRCRQCAMVNWATDEVCRRCHQFLGGQSSQITSDAPSKNSYIFLVLFIAAVLIPILVGKTNPDTGAGLALFFMLAALIVGLFCNVSILVDMFRTSIVWGLAGIFLSPVSTLLFAANYWDRVKGKTLALLAVVAYFPIIFLGMNQLVKPTKIAQNSATPQPTPLTRYLDQAPTPRPDFLPPRTNEAKKKAPNK
jgi:uncharacterized MAPEG superfamily protein